LDRAACDKPVTVAAGCDVIPEVVPGQRAASGQAEVEPRLGLFRDVLDELHWTFSGRRGWLIGIAGNLAFAYAYLAITQGDQHNFGDIKSANVGLAVVVWALADVVNTNQLGSDSDRVRASLEAGDSVARILAIKNLALAVLFIPLAFLISIVHRIIVDHWNLVLHTAVSDVGAVLLWMGVGGVFSVLLPYRPISIRARLKARKTWLRYAICQGAPYVALGVVALMHLPYLLIYTLRAFGPVRSNYLEYALVYLGLAFLYWGLGLFVASLYGHSARERLLSDLHREG
jgi:hypothetical protein